MLRANDKVDTCLGKLFEFLIVCHCIRFAKQKRYQPLIVHFSNRATKITTPLSGEYHLFAQIIQTSLHHILMLALRVRITGPIKRQQCQCSSTGASRLATRITRIATVALAGTTPMIETPTSIHFLMGRKPAKSSGHRHLTLLTSSTSGEQLAFHPRTATFNAATGYRATWC